MHTLILNLTRFGDLLQTQPVVSTLKARGHQVTLGCLDAFAGAARLLRDVDIVLPLPGARILAALDRGWLPALQELTAWLHSGRQTVDRVINLTPTLPARLLGRALGIEDTQGFCLDEQGFGVYSTPWAAFLQAASAHRGSSPFNLVDLFQRVAGLEPGPFTLRRPDEQSAAEAAALLRPYSESGLFALQLGASQDYRRWPVASFVQAARTVFERTGCVPVLLGTAAEQHLAARFAEQAAFPCLNLAGQTSLSVLAAVLERMRLLLTNDTGTMHLAAGLGVPVVAVFLATAQPFDTGPYLEGAISLEPDMDCHPCSFGEKCPHALACRHRFAGEDVGPVLLHLLRGEQPGVVAGARVWQALRDTGGFMNLTSLSGHGGDHRSLWTTTQRHLFGQFLDRQPFALLQNAALPDPACSRPLVAELQHGIMLLTLIEEQGRLVMLRPDSPIRQKFLLNCQKLQDHLQHSAHLGVLGPLWQYQSGEQSARMEGYLALCGRYRELMQVMTQSLLVA